MRKLAFPVWLAVIFLSAPVAGQDDAGSLYAPSVWDLELGAHATELARDPFIDFACGTNGGPPSLPILDWRDYATCRPEPETSYHEVYFEYDNELELWARANGLLTQAALYEFTSVNSVPVTASALFDPNGFMVGLRLVTDPRSIDFADDDGANLAISLGGFLRARYADAEWDCADLPRNEGEQAVAGRFEKRACSAETEDGRDVYLETHHYRRPGQLVIDAIGNRVTQGEFWSETRFEMTLSRGVPDVEERLAEVEAALAAAGPDERAELVLRALDCPGCDLSGVDLKRATLVGANLAGADLTGANLHEAMLRGADLSGAVLDDANLNGANLIQAQLVGASLKGAMMFEARFDGGNLNSADFTQARAGNVQIAGADLTDAVLLAVDLRGSRLNDSVFNGADMRFSWFHDAQLIRADLTGARLSDTIMVAANLSRADLTEADLYNAILTSADFRFANLTGADLSYTRLTYALMTDTVTTGAIWTGAELPGGFDPR